MRQLLGLVSIVVRDYDEAIAFYVGTLGFEVVEDKPQPERQKRWVVVSPPGSSCRLLLARAKNTDELARVGNQTGGRELLRLVALARKLAGIMFALWRDGTTYEQRLVTN
jgi:catechol 2,3-dioxygenase-like lactoylglutathione lyase family enzyme